MKIFPYVLARIAGLPFNTVGDLSWSSNSIITPYLSSVAAIQLQKKELLVSLLLVINEIEDYPAKFYLKIIRRDIFNDRTIKLRSFEYEGLIQEKFYAILEKVEKYKTRLKQWEKELVEYEDAYKKEVDQSRSKLRNTDLPNELMAGLQLASHSLIKRIEKYQDKSGGQVNKKLLQTERTLLQYLTRVATKTSPFSSFTTLSVLDFKHQTVSSAQKKIRLNNTIFQYLKDGLTHYPVFYKKLPIRINPSLNLKSGSYHFLLNTRNIESVQVISKSELIDLIVNELSNKSVAISFDEFILLLTDSIDAEVASLEEYVLELVQYGLIEWQWPFSGLTPDWLSKLIGLLDNFKEEEFLRNLKSKLSEVKDLMVDFEEGTIMQRTETQIKAFQLLKETIDNIFEITDLKEREQTLTSKHLEHILSTSFEISLEQIYYEDVSIALKSKFTASQFQSLLNDLELLKNRLTPFYYNERKSAFLAFFKNNYTTDKVDLIDFYYTYHNTKKDRTKGASSTVVRKRRALLDTLSEQGIWKTEDHFHIDLNMIPSLENHAINQHESVAAFLQLTNNNGELSAFLDATLMGYGKMFGRFLHLFEEPLTEEIKVHNQKLNTKENIRWVENVDASIYNPNIHPSLLDYEIQLPGSQNNQDLEHQIPIQNLEIRLNERGESLYLFDKKSNKQLVVFDFGFEALDNRSPMYQLLSTFNLELTGPELLVDLLDHFITRKEENGIIHKPKISISNQLIIRRRGWGIPISEIPFKLNAESDATYFLKLNDWRTKYNIPSKVFITINAREYAGHQIGRFPKDDYKPQYIDFESPLLVLLFAKLIVKVPVFLKIEEVFPYPEEMLNGQVHASEYLVEF